MRVSTIHIREHNFLGETTYLWWRPISADSPRFFWGARRQHKHLTGHGCWERLAYARGLEFFEGTFLLLGAFLLSLLIFVGRSLPGGAQSLLLHLASAGAPHLFLSIPLLPGRPSSVGRLTSAEGAFPLLGAPAPPARVSSFVGRLFIIGGAHLSLFTSLLP